MRTGRVSVSVVAVLCLAAGAFAQSPENTVVEVHRVTPKPGMTAQLEAGRVKHMAWHKQQGDTWAWHVWEVLTGPQTGSYVVGSPGHEWKDFDSWGAKYGKGDQADANTNLSPYQASSEMSYWVALPDLSRPPAAGTQPAMATLATYHVKPGKANQFRSAVKTIVAAATKGNYPRHVIFYVLANGGPGNTYSALTPRDSMADMALTNPSMRDVVEKELGRGATDAAYESFSDSLEGTSSELLQFRPDLSYVP